MTMAWPLAGKHTGHAMIVCCGPTAIPLPPIRKMTIVIATNDAQRFVPWRCRYVVVGDPPERYPADRLQWIEEVVSNGGILLHAMGWRDRPCDVALPLDSDEFAIARKHPGGVTSGLLAVLAAAAMGFQAIDVYGHDLVGHPVLSHPDHAQAIVFAWEMLHEVLRERDVKLTFGPLHNSSPL